MESVSITPQNKRQKQMHARGRAEDCSAAKGSLLGGEISDLSILFSIAPVDELPPPLESNGKVPAQSNQIFRRASKRSISFLDSDECGPLETREQDQDLENGFDVHNALDMGPSVPSTVDRVVNLNTHNPYHDPKNLRHSNARDIVIPNGVKINGYLKFQLNKQNGPTSSQQNSVLLQPSNGPNGQCPPNGEQIRLLPAGFGSNMKLDIQDGLLWKFYHTAFCPGRTLLAQTNLFLVDFAKMADSNPSVRHSVLALAATYVLDYTQEPRWIERANSHYSEATRLLNEALKQEETHQVGKEDAVVSSFIILTCEDIITWELRRPKHETQRWVQGIQSAIEILDQSNPGYRYNHPVNVQSNATRTANQNLIASFDIVARPVMPFDYTKPSSNFKWLIHGTDREQQRIHGGTGVSPKLLHIFSQITVFAEKITKDPECVITPHGAAVLEKRLVGFRQWSELSEGFASEKELLAACKLNHKGQVSSRAEVTDLTGQSWVSAAQIYLQCRIYRRPRSHRLVKAPLNTLLRCIERMPCTGSLFTSQSPFFPIFIMGVVSNTKEERSVARVWFDTVVLGLSCRSSVPPVWTALQELWTWMDHNLDEDDADFNGPIAERKAWWEQMVDNLMNTHGILSLC